MRRIIGIVGSVLVVLGTVALLVLLLWLLQLMDGQPPTKLVPQETTGMESSWSVLMLRTGSVPVQGVQALSPPSPSRQGHQAVAGRRPEVSTADGAAGREALRVHHRDSMACRPAVHAHHSTPTVAWPSAGFAA